MQKLRKIQGNCARMEAERTQHTPITGNTKRRGCDKENPLLPPSPTTTTTHHHHHHHQSHAAQGFFAHSSGATSFVVSLAASQMMAGGEVDGEGAARRRRQRRLRSWLKHERQSVAMALAEYTHHASRGQTRARAREEAGSETNYAPRGPKTPASGDATGASV